MPIQGQLKGKIPTQQRDKSRVAAVGPNADISAGVSQQTQQLQEAPNADISVGVSNEDNKELLRKNSAILENLNLMYETIHNETQLLKTLKQETTKEEPPIFEKKQEEPQQNDKSARVLEPKQVIKKNKSMIPLFKKKPNQPAPALLPRWR